MLKGLNVLYFHQIEDKITGVFLMMPCPQSRHEAYVAAESDQVGYDNAALVSDDADVKDTNSDQQSFSSSEEQDNQMMQDLIISLNKTLLQ